ncbi:MAG: hypothetical protein JW901_11330 [Dehalococcoidia bacterium]|nr:hypothetical protein [Dehalococcoidia bacterium]
MKLKLILFVALIFVAGSFIGCKDIAGTLKARFNRATQPVATSSGNFGNTAEETAMINAITDKYGDLRESGSPRILELMLTSNVVNYIPADRVSQYSKDVDKFYAWFIYDNFNENTISVEWIYLEDDYSIGTSKSATGKDFGRGSFTLEAPDEGWPLGSYRVKVSGAGVTESVDFSVVDGATQSVAILLPDGSVDLAGASSAVAAGDQQPEAGADTDYYPDTTTSPVTDTGWNAGATTTPASTPAATSTCIEYTIFNNINTGAVSSGPQSGAVFTITEPHLITSIMNYHWNGAKGATPGKISLKHADGTVYGSWQASPAYSNGDDDNDPPYHYWRVKPNVTIKAGTYVVNDSDPSTWSYNAASKNAGFTQVKGCKTSSGTATAAAGAGGTSGTSATSSSSSAAPGSASYFAGSLAGTWAVNFNNYTGKMEFWVENGKMVGRLYLDAHGRWETLKNISCNSQTGAVTFYREAGNQTYTGTIKDRDMAGTFSSPGGTVYKWVAKLSSFTTTGQASASSAAATTSSTTTSTSSSTSQGVWHRKSYQYVPYAKDGQPQSTYLAGTTSVLIDCVEASGGRLTGFKVKSWRTDAKGNIVGAGTATECSSTTLTVVGDPPEYIKPGDKPSMSVSHKLITPSSWGSGNLVVSLGSIHFKAPDGTYTLTPQKNFSGTVTLPTAVSKGTKGATMQIVANVYLYKFIFTYEWLE